tara:strand:- start:6318 stop:7202 length:885 start_codon:yes stop_codon:yes gene_type:complete
MLVNPWSVFSEITSHYPKLATEQVPVAVGFEHNLSSRRFDSISYLYSFSDLFSVLDNNLPHPNSPGLSPLEHAAHLLLLDKSVLPMMLNLSVDKFWIEIDNFKASSRLQLYFQLPLVKFNDLRPCLVTTTFDDLNSRLFSSQISYLGFVFSGKERIGYKVLATGNSGLLDSTSVVRIDLARLAMSTLSNPLFQVGFAFSEDQILGESIEIDALKDSRFSSCDKWCQLFEAESFSQVGISLSSAEIGRTFGIQQWSSYNLLSGINHLKFGHNFITNELVIKLYSGILFTECSATR